MDQVVDVVLKLLEIGTVLCSAGAVFYRMGRMAEKFEQAGTRHADAIVELKMTTKELAQGQARVEELAISRAVQSERLDTLDRRVTDLDAKVERIRTGSRV